MSGRDDFLSRWSRRKLEARAPEPDPEIDREPGTEPAGTEAPQPPEGADLPSETEPPPDLPAVEDLTADADLSGFFRQGVPEALRNAALRRMWSLDPAVRDFVGDARDYAYDWNTPGGVPGFGPLLPGDDVAAMVEKVFGTSGTVSEAPDPPPSAAAVRLDDDAHRDAERAEAAAADPSESGSEAEGAPGSASEPELTGEDASAQNPVPPGTESVHDPATGPDGARPRRHGGAIPV